MEGKKYYNRLWLLNFAILLETKSKLKTKQQKQYL